MSLAMVQALAFSLFIVMPSLLVLVVVIPHLMQRRALKRRLSRVHNIS